MQTFKCSTVHVYRVVESCVCNMSHIAFERIHGVSRGTAHEANARHLAMYLCHVIGGFTFTSLAIHYCRDRTTIRHACTRIEKLRDDSEFDSALSCLETGLATFFDFTDIIERFCNEGTRTNESGHHVAYKNCGQQ